MRVTAKIVDSVMIYLAASAITFGNDDLVFSDSFEECLVEPLVVWSGDGDGTSWSDPLNWKGNQVPVDNDGVRISDQDEVTVVFDNSADPVSINCLSSDESVQMTGGTLNIIGSSTINADLIISNGTLSVADKLRVGGEMHHSGGTVDGTGQVTVQGLYNWSAGNQNGSGETLAAGGMALSGGAHKDLNFRTLTLEGNTTYAGAGSLRVHNGVTLNNNGSFEIQNDSLFDHRSGDLSTFNNNGTLTKTAGAGTTTVELHFNNAGSVLVDSGTLRLGISATGGSSEGSFEVASGATLGLQGNQTLLPASTLSGDGNFSFSGGGSSVIQGSYTIMGSMAVSAGTLTFNTTPVTLSSVTISGGTLNATSALTVSGMLQQTAGVLDGTGQVTVQGLYNWSAGNQNGSGETLAAGGMALSGGAHKDLNFRTLTLEGNTTYAGAGSLRVHNGVTLNNNGSFEIQNDSLFDHRSGDLSTFNNNGTLTKTAGAGTTAVELHFNNAGSVLVDSGTLRLGISATGGSSEGSFEVASGATLGLQGNQTLLPASTLSGDGNFSFSGGGSSVIQGSYTIMGSMAVSAGTLTFNTTPVTLSSVTISGGTLNATSALTVSGMLQQTAGVLDGTGQVTVQGLYNWSAGNQNGSGETLAAGGMALSGGAHKDLNFRTLTLEGNTTYAGAGSLRVHNGVTLNNNGSFEIQNDSLFDHRSGDLSTFNNNGTLTKTAGAGTTTVELHFNNAGSVLVDSGTLSFSQNFLQDVSGTINVGIASGDFDSYVIGNAATLDGTLNINLEGVFQPGLGVSFQIMTFGSRAGTFSTVNGTIIGNGNKFDVSYGAVDVTLEVVADN